MTPEEQAAQARIQYIAKQQEILAEQVKQAQTDLFSKILARLEKITENPAELTGIFRNFTAGPYKQLVSRFVAGIMTVGKLNGEYFTAIFERETPKNYAAIKASADDALMTRFGIDKAGNVTKDGFLDLFIRDTTVERQAKQFAYNAVSKQGVGLDEFKKGLRAIIEGDKTRVGGYERYFNQYAYDTYQQADSLLQEQYATRLELQACLYAGGLIADSRPFCKERNGKVFIREEIEDWASLEFAGKPAAYNPFIDRGGYNCRHHLNYITNKMALRRRPDLELDSDNKLRVKKQLVA